MAFKQPQRSNLKSDLKFMAQTTYATIFVWAVLTFMEHMAERRTKKERTQLTSTRLVGFTAGKKLWGSREENRLHLSLARLLYIML